MAANVKQEIVEAAAESNRGGEIIALSSSSSDLSSDDGGSDVELSPKKKRRVEAVLPVGFLEPIRPASGGDGGVKRESVEDVSKEVVAVNNVNPVTTVALMPSFKQFWKAGDYEGGGDGGKIYDGTLNFLPLILFNFEFFFQEFLYFSHR